MKSVDESETTTKARRRWWIPFAVIALLPLLLLAASARAVLAPHQDEVDAQVDAVVVLGGSYGAGFREGVRLVEAGAAHTLVVSTPPVDGGHFSCDDLPGVSVYCFVPDPSTTRGEARELRDLTARHRWRTLLVIATGGPHVERARYVIERCVHVDLRVVGAPGDHGVAWTASQWVYQTAGWIRALAQDGC